MRLAIAPQRQRNKTSETDRRIGTLRYYRVRRAGEVSPSPEINMPDNPVHQQQTSDAQGVQRHSPLRLLGCPLTLVINQEGTLWLTSRVTVHGIVDVDGGLSNACARVP